MKGYMQTYSTSLLDLAGYADLKGEFFSRERK
jgi:hypothetical protein